MIIEGLPKTPNSMLRQRWWVVKKEKDKWLALISAHSAGKRPKEPLAKATVTIIRHSSKAPDFDALAGSGKYLIDPLVKLGILVDDNMEIIGKPEYDWVKAKPKKGFIEIIVNETRTNKIP